TSLNVFCDFVEEYFAAHGEMPDPYLIEQNCNHWFDLGFDSDDERHQAYLQYKNADGWSEPALGPDGTIYVSFDDPYLRAIDPNGTIKWVTPLGDLGGFTLTVGSDSLIYAAGDDGSLYVVDANGWPLAHFQTDNWLNYPVIAADNMIIVTDGKDDSLMITDPPNTVWAISQKGCRDLNFDGSIDFNDIVLLAADWLACTDVNSPCNYAGPLQYLITDVDRDRYVRLPDLALIASRWMAAEKVLRPLPNPGRASNPYPPNGAADAWPINLSWTPGSDTASYDVYFGTDNPPPLVANQTATTFEPELLLYNTTYYWRIDGVNAKGKTTGEPWNFTTRETGGR
ncbi:MAG: PQQ-binding-like beta-propeller repeat protein, partial [Planctomycetes bacterium]|nr:PQQ-binding-like beta-propeller repeat protein [Planctomycetota bacterium]